MRGLQVLSFILSIVVTICSAASVTESVGISDIMSAAYQLKARMEMQNLEAMAFQARTLAKLQKIRADLELREETEKLELERVRASAPRGIRGAPGPAGMAGEPGEPGLRGIQGSRGEDGKDGRVPNEASLLQDINQIQAVAKLNRNYLDQLVLPNETTLGNCGGVILLAGQETIGLNNYWSVQSCSWVVWSSSETNMRLKVKGPQDAQYNITVTNMNGGVASVPLESWISVNSRFARIDYSTDSAYNQPFSLVVEPSSANSNTIRSTNNLMYSGPFALTYPLYSASQYRDNERTFIIGNSVCGNKPTSVRIYDVDMEDGVDWLETYWLDTHTGRLSSKRVTGRSGSTATLIIPPFTSFVSLFRTDGSVVGRGFKIRAECKA